jgi:hypothetical protein
MKLTKGKVSKILNKKNQSKKKYKKLIKKNKNINTFRKRHLNLANKTLKRITGGDDGKTKLDESLSGQETPPTNLETPTQSQDDVSLGEREKDNSMLSNEVPVTTREDSNDFVSQNKIPEEPLIFPPADMKSRDSETSSLSDEERPSSTLFNDIDEENASDTTTNTTNEERKPEEQPLQLETQETSEASESPTQLETQEISEEQPHLERQETPLISTTNEKTSGTVTESFNQVIDFLSSQIASKVVSHMNLSSNETSNMNQDAFETVNHAAETMALNTE